MVVPFQSSELVPKRGIGGLQRSSMAVKLWSATRFPPLSQWLYEATGGGQRFGVDYTHLYFSSSKGSAEAMQEPDHCIEAVMGWMWVSKLKRNANKTEAVWFSGCQVQELGRRPVLVGVTHTLKERVCSFGALLGPSLVGTYY